MAKSPTEQFREVMMELATITERLNNFRDSMGEQRSANVRSADKVAELTTQIADIRQEIALLRQRLDDHLKRIETWDTRRWGLIAALVVALFGAALSLASGLIVTLARK